MLKAILLRTKKIDENFRHIMTQENKELLLTDLCARLRYGVKLYVNITETSFCSSYVNKVKDTKINGSVRLCGIQDNGIRITVPYGTTMFISNWELEKCELKPYLRQMSSMTEEEKAKFFKEVDKDCDILEYALNTEPDIIFGNRRARSKGSTFNEIDWLNANHFDYRGLIERGLALEAPEGMYNDKQ